MRGASIRTMSTLYTEWRTREYAGFQTYEVVDYTDGGTTRTVLHRCVGEDAQGRSHDWLFENPKTAVPIHPPQQGPWQAREPYRHPTNYTGD